MGQQGNCTGVIPLGPKTTAWFLVRVERVGKGVCTVLTDDLLFFVLVADGPTSMREGKE